MSSGREEVYAAVDSGVWYFLLAVDMQLLPQIFLILFIDVLRYGLPTGDRVSVSIDGSTNVSSINIMYCPEAQGITEPELLV